MAASQGVRSDEAGRAVPAAEDLVRRRFRAPGPNRLWVADITYVPTWEGYLFLATVIDAWSRRSVGWSMRDDLRSELVLDALGMGVTRRRPQAGVIHHFRSRKPGRIQSVVATLDREELRWARRDGPRTEPGGR